MKFYHTKRFKLIAFSFIILASIAFGYVVRPGIELAIGVVSDVFAINEKRDVYVAPPTEYETKVEALWKSDKHQAVCKANAASTISLELTRKYLDEYDKQNILAQWDTPLSEIKPIKVK